VGTSIKIEAWRDEEHTTKEQWNSLIEYMMAEFDDFEDMGDCLKTGLVYCSYRGATIKAQFDEELLTKLIGSGITFNLYYEEREPDSIIVLDNNDVREVLL